MEENVYEYFRKIDALGGVIPAIEKGFFSKEIATAAYHYQKEIETKERILVGVNDYIAEEPLNISLVKMDSEGEKRHLERLNRVRRERENIAVSEKLERVGEAAKKKQNLMPFILDAVRCYATLGEVCGILRKVFGEYKPDTYTSM
jgi:methylmalonyl-CoA mutase N-terminal domain/subunit